MPQLPKCGLVRGHDKARLMGVASHRSFPGGIPQLSSSSPRDFEASNALDAWCANGPCHNHCTHDGTTDVRGVGAQIGLDQGTRGDLEHAICCVGGLMIYWKVSIENVCLAIGLE